MATQRASQLSPNAGSGPGTCTRLTEYYNLEKFLTVLHDQCGAARIKPHPETRENTTQHLVPYIDRPRKHLNIDGKIYLFGGSGTSMQALACAETYPEHVQAYYGNLEAAIRWLMDTTFGASDLIEKVRFAVTEMQARLVLEWFPRRGIRRSAANDPRSTLENAS